MLSLLALLLVTVAEEIDGRMDGLLAFLRPFKQCFSHFRTMN